MIYLDTSYVARLYLNDPGWEKVRQLAATDHVACCIHGRAETVSAFHRKIREGAIGSKELTALLKQFGQDCETGAFRWLALSEAVIARLTKVYASLSSKVTLRAADVFDLSSAAEQGMKEI